MRKPAYNQQPIDITVMIMGTLTARKEICRQIERGTHLDNPWDCNGQKCSVVLYRVKVSDASPEQKIRPILVHIGTVCRSNGLVIKQHIAEQDKGLVWAKPAKGTGGVKVMTMVGRRLKQPNFRL